MSYKVPQDSGPLFQFLHISEKIKNVSHSDGHKWVVSESLFGSDIEDVLHKSFDLLSAAEKTQNLNILEECEVKLKDAIKQTETIQNVNQIGLKTTGLEKQEIPRLTKEESDEIKHFYADMKGFLESADKPVFFNRNIKFEQSSVLLPRSLVYIPKGPSKGAYVLLKQHEGEKQLGIGAHNRVTLAVNLETGELVGWRSARKESILPSEILANVAATRYPEFFDAADNFVEYQSNIRPDSKTRDQKTGDHLKADKIGSIVKLAKGGDLTAYLQNKNIPLVDRLNIFLELQQSLHVLHTDLKKTHRDLKGANLNMTEDGHLKIADFGLTVDNDTSHESKGSLLWMAPEALLGMQQERELIAAPSSDIWSSGVILLQMLDDNKAWHNNFTFDVIQPIQQNTFSEAKLNQIKSTVYATVRKNLSNEGCSQEGIDGILSIVDKCLSMSPEKRPPAIEIRDDIAKIVGAL